MPDSFGILSVWLHGRRVGTLHDLGGDRSIFSFEQDYANDPLRPTLGLGFLDAERNLKRPRLTQAPAVHPFFSNLLPEGALRTLLAIQQGVKQVRELPMLEFLGEDLPGAVIVRPESEGPPPPQVEEQFTLPQAAATLKLKFSLPGVQMKLSAGGTPEHGLTIPAYGRGGRFILKMPSHQYPDLPKNEHAMMRLAASIGITTADNGLVPLHSVTNLPTGIERLDAPALWVRRFDRTAGGERIHMEDFNQVYEQFPADKYKNYSYGNLARDIFSVGGIDDLVEFIRRLVFSIAIGNDDMHLKNWSLLYADRRAPRLAPAYDFVSTIAYLPGEAMALSVHRAKDVRLLDSSRWMQFIERASLPAHAVMETIKETSRRTVRAWRGMAPDLDFPDAWRTAIDNRMKSVPFLQPFLP